MNKSIFIWLVALPVAILSMMASAGSVTKLTNPGLSISMWPQNGFAFAEMAEIRLKQAVVDSNGDLGAPLDDQTVGYARAALLHEPTSTAAIRILALARENKKQQKQAFALMDHAGKLSKRDPVTNLWLGKAKGVGGSTDQLVYYFDLTLRTNSAARPILLQTVADGLSNAEFVEPLTQILKAKPEWSDEFWDYAVRTNGSVENAALVRVGLFKAGETEVDAKDQQLVAALIRNKNFDRGLELYKAFQPAGGNDMGFGRIPQLPPYDWELVSRGDYGATITPDSARLDINSITLKGGVVARRLIALSRRNYQLSAKLQDSPGSEGFPLYISIACAEKSGQQAREQRVVFSRGKVATAISRVDPQCTYHWLKIGISDVDSGRGFDAAISQLSLLPL